MRIRRNANPWLSLLLSFVLLSAILPATEVRGAEMSWAADAVSALNGIYGPGAFSASDETVTADDARNLLTDVFRYPADHPVVRENAAGEGDFTRVQAAHAVYDVYKLQQNLSAGPFSDSDDPAVITLRTLGIVNGDGSGSFRPAETITKAELAVIFYRALKSVGGLGGSLFPYLAPGEFGYEEFAYLAARGIVLREGDPKADISSVTVSVYADKVYSYYGKKNIWNALSGQLMTLSGPRDPNVTWAVYDQVPGSTFFDMALYAASQNRRALVAENERNVFSDVTPGDYFYDGVMYLFNIGMVSGTGGGLFKPNDLMTRQELAAFMCRINRIDTTRPAENVILADRADVAEWAYGSVTQAVYNGLLPYKEGNTFGPKDQVTRQEIFNAVYRSYGLYADEKVNEAVLDRFADQADIGEAYRTAAAYMVSVGLVKGTGEGRLAPAGVVTRGQIAMFLARIMQGIDASKMHDYNNAVREVLK